MKTGNFYMTKGVADAIERNTGFAETVQNCIDKYLLQDWGDMCAEDKKLNDNAIKNNDRILAAYQTDLGKLYIITEWDRSATTVLFACEY